MSLSFVKNKELLEPLLPIPHAFATFSVDKSKHDRSIFEEIAIGQTLGAWETSIAEIETLRGLVAKIVSFEEQEHTYVATVAIPVSTWHGRLAWLMAILYGKMSFYEGIQLSSVRFSDDAFSGAHALPGPRHDISDLRTLVGAAQNVPLLMGILKPNVAMPDEKIADLYEQVAEAGVHIVKDDEIRHDDSPLKTLSRVKAVAKRAASKNLKTLYAVHFQADVDLNASVVRELEDAGANALLLNVWTSGLGTLQWLRSHTRLPILAHPALVGAFGLGSTTSRIHPKVTLGQLLRAGGADLSLFPSPYGKLGLPLEVAQSIANVCLNDEQPVKKMTPVPSAGIKPEHGPLARKDFGHDFVLNAGTGIFAASVSPAHAVQAFRKGLYEGNS